MKIAMIGHKQFPSRSGGVEVVVNELSTRMSKLGHEVTVYNRYHVDKPEKNFQKEFKGVKIKRALTLSFSKFDAMLSSLTATFSVIFGKYDVVHYHAEGPSAMIWLPKMFGIRVICTNHGLDWKRDKWGGIAKRYIKFGEKMSAKYADELIVLSTGIEKYFIENYGRKTQLISNGVNQPKYKILQKAKWDFKLQKNEYILALVRLVPEKGIHYLIEAFKKVETKKKLVIAGSGTSNYEQYLREIASSDTRIIFTGFADFEMVRELYTSAYLYVLPSDVEGLPIGLLEAMSFGRCVLVSDIPENISVINDFGRSFKKGSAISLSKELSYLLSNPDLVKELGNKSKKYVLEKYNWEEIVNRTLSVYKGENM
ncbi:MAG: glycosyltransferase family 4 protein [Enterococcus avium]